jgi:hypothetical protein
MNFCERCTLTSYFLCVIVVIEPSLGLIDSLKWLFSREVWMSGIRSAKEEVVEVSIQGEVFKFRAFKAPSQ